MTTFDSEQQQDESSSATVCVECGQLNAKYLYKVYSGGSIQLSKCDNCSKFLDKYCEFDGVLLLLDVFLLRLQAYRHLIFNYKLSNKLIFRLVVALLLCGAYINSRLINLQTDNFILLQLNFHFSLIHAITEFFIMVGLSLIATTLFESRSAASLSWLHTMLKAIIVTSFSKWFAVVAFIWVDEFYIQLLLLLALPAQLRSYQAIFPDSGIAAFAVVLAQGILVQAVNIALGNAKMKTLEYLNKVLLH